MQNHYQSLGLENFSNTKEIKNAYRKLSKKYHPDSNCEEASSIKFIAIKTAYDFLMNHESKSNLDSFLKSKEKRLNTKKQNELLIQVIGTIIIVILVYFGVRIALNNKPT